MVHVRWPSGAVRLPDFKGIGTVTTHAPPGTHEHGHEHGHEHDPSDGEVSVCDEPPDDDDMYWVSAWDSDE